MEEKLLLKENLEPPKVLDVLINIIYSKLPFMHCTGLITKNESCERSTQPNNITTYV